MEGGLEVGGRTSSLIALVTAGREGGREGGREWEEGGRR